MTQLAWVEQPGGAPADPARWPVAVRRWARRAGLIPVGQLPTGPEDLVLSGTNGDGEQLPYLPEVRRLGEESYRLAVTGGPPRRVEISYGGAPGLRWALNDVSRMRASGNWSAPAGLSYPRFPLRGVIEGFYGRPWSHAQRRDMLGFLADHNLNAYCYAPKDDPYLRRRWAEPYPDRQLARLAELVEAAHGDQVGFWYAISPGLSMRYADPGDLAALLAKLRQVYELGVRRFGLLLDDIPPRLQHPLDRSTFTDLAGAHAYLVGEVYERLRDWDAAIELAACPTRYCGTGEEDYPRRLGTAIDPRIHLFWTGRAICAPTLDAADAATFARAVLRPPLYWDNYPVNDVGMVNEIHIGPYRGRDPLLFRFAAGVFANGMTHPESSKIAFATIADYLWDPAGYEPEASWERALAAVAGSADAEPLRRFADTVRTSCLAADDAPELAAELDRFRFDRQFGDPAAAAARLGTYAEAMVGVARRLRGGMANRALRAELAPWLQKYHAGARVLGEVARLVSGGVGGGDQLAGDQLAGDQLGGDQLGGRIGALRAELAGQPARVFGDVLDMFLSELIDEVTEEG